MGDFDLEKFMKDPRFTKYQNDPRFHHVPKTQRKVKIDKRFQSMFKDEKFKLKYTVDKRGRPTNKSSSEDLKKYYDMSSDEGSDEDEEKKNIDATLNDSGKYVRAPQSSDESSDDNKDKDNLMTKYENTSEKLQCRLKDLDVDYARGEGILLTDSSSDDDSSSEDEPELKLDHCWGELDCDAEHTKDATRRLAVCNMDWDRMRAEDIMVLCSSFLPPGGAINSVTIYPSEYGLKRMKEEETKGPIELTDGAEQLSESDNEENEEGSKFHMERLRQYQLNRLKYYYAVIVCDSVTTADKLYTECDGLEYESTATRLDLRFIPDDVTFDEKPHQACHELPELNKYQPRQFTTTALQQAKVELTWDETCPERKEISQKLMSGKMDEVTDADLRNYLAFSSEEEPDEVEDMKIEKKAASPKKINTNKEDSIKVENENGDSGKEASYKKTSLDKYKDLLLGINQEEENRKNDGVEIEITWGVSSKDKAEKMVKNKMEEKQKYELTPFEQLVEKKKEKQKVKREGRKKQQETADDGSSDSSDDIPDGIDMNDPYFTEEFNSNEFRKPKSQKNKKNTEKELLNEDEKQKQELELLLLNENDDGKSHFSFKKIQDAENESKSKSKRRKRQLKKKKEIVNDNKNDSQFEVNVNDGRFAALYTSHHYNIDPTDPHFKRTKGMEVLISEKLKRRPNYDTNVEALNIKKPKRDVAVNMLVKNIKRKVAKN